MIQPQPQDCLAEVYTLNADAAGRLEHPHRVFVASFPSRDCNDPCVNMQLRHPLRVSGARQVAIAEAAAPFQAYPSFADDTVVVSIVHARISWMPPVDRRNPGRFRLGAGNSAVAVGIPLSPIAAGPLLVLITRRLLLLGG